jgi:hypothetical protein
MLLVSQQVGIFDARSLPPGVGGAIVSRHFLSLMVVSRIAPALAPRCMVALVEQAPSRRCAQIRNSVYLTMRIDAQIAASNIHRASWSA